MLAKHEIGPHLRAHAAPNWKLAECLARRAEIQMPLFRVAFTSAHLAGSRLVLVFSNGIFRWPRGVSDPARASWELKGGVAGCWPRVGQVFAGRGPDWSRFGATRALIGSLAGTVAQHGQALTAGRG